MSDYMFGDEAGPGNPAMSHVRAAPERRTPAPGPAGAGDERAQRGAGALAVLAQDAAVGGPDGVVSAAPSEIATGVSSGVHFTGTGAATPGFGGAPGAAGLPGAAPTSGPAPAQQGSRGWLEYGGNTVPAGSPPNATPSAKLGSQPV